MKKLFKYIYRIYLQIKTKRKMRYWTERTNRITTLYNRAK